MILPSLLLCLVPPSLTVSPGDQDPAPSDPYRFDVEFAFAPARGLGQEEGVCRRDPSDVVRVGDEWFVWYTKVVRAQCVAGKHGYPSGYQGSVWGAVSTDAGATWEELGEAVPKGPAGAFDCTATFTPNILVWKDRYYLAYTAVGPDFDNGPYEDRNRTSLGVAAAPSPRGPWKKLADTPVFATSRDPGRFDSYRVDDACFLVREGSIWMYYKGRQWENTPGNTRMGVATATNPTGPFVRANDGRFVQDSGHEVLVWPHDGGVMSLVSATGPRGRTLQWAADGISFEVVGKLPSDYPRAPGLYRPDLTGATPPDVPWGIAMRTYRGDPHLHRYEMRIAPREGEK